VPGTNQLSTQTAAISVDATSRVINVVPFAKESFQPFPRGANRILLPRQFITSIVRNRPRESRLRNEARSDGGASMDNADTQSFAASTRATQNAPPINNREVTLSVIDRNISENYESFGKVGLRNTRFVLLE
jgi:hypothetical protein